MWSAIKAQNCDCTLDPYDFIADTTIENTGSLGTMDRVDVTWHLSGGNDVKRSAR